MRSAHALAKTITQESADLPLLESRVDRFRAFFALSVSREVDSALLAMRTAAAGYSIYTRYIGVRSTRGRTQPLGMGVLQV